MRTQNRLADFDHPLVEKKAAELTRGREAPLDKVASIFHFVRDETRFGFPRALKRLRASGHPFGYSVSFIDGKSSCEFN